jgi:hypothetical protein
MVKVQKISQEELLKEDERLERMFKQTILKSKNIQINEKQFRNRLVDFLEIISKSTNHNGKMLAVLISRYPSILNKLCLSSRYEYLNGQKIMNTILEVLQKSTEDLAKQLEGVEQIIKTIFNILIYKKVKHFIPELVKMITILLNSKNVKIEKLIEKNLDILINFIEKGKDIDKVFFSFKKIIGKSSLCLNSRFEELVAILSKTKNSFYLEYFLKFMVENFSSKTFKESFSTSSNGNGHSADKNLKNTVATIDRHIQAVYQNLAPKENASAEQVKRSLKMKTHLIRVIEALSDTPKVALGSNTSRVLELLNNDVKPQTAPEAAQNENN